MTFLLLGLDGLDWQLSEEYSFNDKIDDTPVELGKLDQNLPEVISEKGETPNNTGHWTFYIWGAIASGQVQTPEIRQEHPTRSQVEWPLKLKYLRHAPKSFIRYIKGRVKRRPRYKSFAWDMFENVRVINYPITLPEYTEDSALVKENAISRDYGALEWDVLKTEINDALEKNYDAVFVVTRNIDCHCHGATSPLNYGEDGVDDWWKSSVGKDFEEVHEQGMDIRDFAEEEGDLDVSNEARKDAAQIKQEVIDHVEDSYDEAASLINSVKWDEVDEYVVVSDHGFDSLGAGSVNAHGRAAVLDTSFGYWRKMSAFIKNWRQTLTEKLRESEKYD